MEREGGRGKHGEVFHTGVPQGEDGALLLVLKEGGKGEREGFRRF